MIPRPSTVHGETFHRKSLTSTSRTPQVCNIAFVLRIGNLFKVRRSRAETSSVIRPFAVLVVLAAALMPAGIASADPDDISKPADVLRSANRLGAQVSTVPAP